MEDKKARRENDRQRDRELAHKLRLKTMEEIDAEERKQAD